MSLMAKQSGCGAPGCPCNCMGHRGMDVKHIMPCCPHPHREPNGALDGPLGALHLRRRPGLTAREEPAAPSPTPEDDCGL